MRKTPKIAIVCDWLTNMGGAEKVVLAFHKAFPDAPIYTSVFIPEACPEFSNLDIRTTWMQRMPKSLRKRHQLFPILRAYAFRGLDLSDYDIVLSSASAEAKAIKVGLNTIHICYCHTPIRYYWSHYEAYKKEPGLGFLGFFIRPFIPAFVHWMRKLDLASVKSVTYFIANSSTVQQRIKKYYKRDATVVHPPVQFERLIPRTKVKKENYFLIVGRQIPYKRFDIAIKACNQLGKELILIGKGSEHQRLQAMAGPTIKFLSDINDTQVVEYFQKASAFLFPQDDDFGITAIEALASATPVIAYNSGGAKDFVLPYKTGILFDEQTAESLVQAIQEFKSDVFSSTVLTSAAKEYSEEKFIRHIKAFIQDKIEK